jgi:hypothetical protein
MVGLSGLDDCPRGAARAKWGECDEVLFVHPPLRLMHAGMHLGREPLGPEPLAESARKARDEVR